MPIDAAELDKEIVKLFTALKRKIRDITWPRSNWLDEISDLTGKYFGIAKKPTLAEYATAQSFLNEFRSQLNEAKLDDLDQLVNDYRDRLRAMIKGHLNQAPTNAPQPVTTPQPNPQPSITPEPPQAAPEPVKAPTPTPQPAAKAPEPVKVPEPAVKPPEPVAKPVAKAPEPAVRPPEPIKQPEDPEDKLVRLGKALKGAKNLAGEGKVVTQDVINWVVDQLIQRDYKPQMETPERRQELIKLAKEYQSKPKPGLETPVVAPMNVPEKPVEQSEEEKLMLMPGPDFKEYMLQHDPDLVGAYQGQAWWRKPLRKEIVTSYMQMMNLQKAKTESLAERVQYYKNKLNSHDKSASSGWSRFRTS